MLGNSVEYADNDLLRSHQTHQVDSKYCFSSHSNVRTTRRGTQRSSHTRRSSLHGARNIHMSSNTPSSTEAELHPTRFREGPPERRMEGDYDLIDEGQESSPMVGLRGIMAGKRQRHCASREAHPDQSSNRRRLSQRRIRWRDDIERSGVLHPRAPDHQGTSREVHKRVRILGVSKHSLVSASGGGTESRSMASDPRGHRIGQRDGDPLRAHSDWKIDQDVSKGSTVLRRSRESGDLGILSTSRGDNERSSRQVESSTHDARIGVYTHP